MPEIELAQLVLALLADVDAQFEFWLTVTFGVLVASFVAAERLSRRLRMLLAFFYVWASALFFVRYLAASAYLNSYVELAAQYEVSVLAPISPLAGRLRFTLWVVGGITTALLVVRGHRPRHEPEAG